MTSILDAIETGAEDILEEGEVAVEKIWSEVEPAIVQFLSSVSHDFVTEWIPQAEKAVEGLLASGTAITTSTIGSLALELETSALATGKQVLAQDALTTVQAAAAKVAAKNAE